MSLSVQIQVILNSEEPKWDEHFNVPVAHPASKLELQVKDNDLLGAELMGEVSIPMDAIITGKKINGWFSIVGTHRCSKKTCPELKLSIQFKHVECNPLHSNGVGKFPNFSGAPNAYFPLHKDGNVTLYQDAHVPDGALPKIVLDDGKIFEQSKCWEDICQSILEAHHLIYIIGWLIFHPVKLVREPTKPLPRGGELSLGELLKHKSEEDVHVLLLTWDDKTSHDKLLLKTDGVMQTHGEEARKFFKHSSIHCVLAPRYASNKLSILKQQIYVMVDMTHLNVGGYLLIWILYLQMIFIILRFRLMAKVQDKHGMICTVKLRVGSAAYDVVTNFEQRWRKVTKWRDFRFKKEYGMTTC